MPRKHRRVHHPKTNCRCPEGSKKVETCSKKGDSAKCKGRNMGCIAMVQVPGAKRPMPRFVKMICDPVEAGPVEQWKPPKGYRKRKRRLSKAEQMALRFNRPTVPPPAARTEEQLRLHFNNNRKTAPVENNAKTVPWWWRT